MAPVLHWRAVSKTRRFSTSGFRRWFAARILLAVGIGLTLAALTGAGCGGEPPAEPAGLVSLLPSFTEVVVELGAADRLVGCTSYCRPGPARENQVVRVPWQSTDAVEPILRLRPALVLRQTPRSGEDALHKALTRAGIRVVSLPSETTSDALASMERIGAELGRAEAGRALAARVRETLEQARKAAADRPVRKVLFVIGRDASRIANIQAAGRGTFLHELLEIVGARNVVADRDEAYPRVELDQLVALQPDVIIDNLPREDDPMASWSQIRRVPAIENRRVRFVRGFRVARPGTAAGRSGAAPRGDGPWRLLKRAPAPACGSNARPSSTAAGTGRFWATSTSTSGGPSASR